MTITNQPDSSATNGENTGWGALQGSGIDQVPRAVVQWFHNWWGACNRVPDSGSSQDIALAAAYAAISDFVRETAPQAATPSLGGQRIDRRESIADNADAMIILTQDYPREAKIRIVDAHTERNVRAALNRESAPSTGGQVDERALFSVAYAVRDWYKGQWPSHEGINGWNPPFAEIVSAAITQQDAPEAPARITFAHEVDGPWRLELNGVTISRHETRGELDRAIKALFAALNRKPPC